MAVVKIKWELFVHKEGNSLGCQIYLVSKQGHLICSYNGKTAMRRTPVRIRFPAGLDGGSWTVGFGARGQLPAFLLSEII